MENNYDYSTMQCENTKWQKARLVGGYQALEESLLIHNVAELQPHSTEAYILWPHLALSNGESVGRTHKGSHLCLSN